ncbi:lectin C-type domain protein [Ancylostoma caninum]|uniref:Lectin C-type domain protein n=1 Tax=Ancylostoma caninum TaxID=29170 RepID=A0A368GZ94_ANCCA|nr:lectin C-type domain protein [Ancylostoma caninum]
MDYDDSCLVINAIRCYIFTSEPAPFALAEQNCINLGGHLVSISNAFENDIISDNAKTALSSTNATDFWIGASDLVTTGKWAWTDDSNFLYTNWAAGQPQSGKDCASSRLNDGRWLANGCSVTKAYACAVPPQLASTCPPPPTCPTLTTPTPAVCTQRRCAAHCDSEWTYFVQANSCYKLFFGQKWDDAEAFCIEQGGHLASVHSEQENTFVANLARTNEKQSNPHELTWIGLKASGNAWVWSDKTKVDYINWAPKQPDNPGKENCVQIAQDPSDHGWYENWNNEDCNTVMRAFVCKKSSIV